MNKLIDLMSVRRPATPLSPSSPRAFDRGRFASRGATVELRGNEVWSSAPSTAGMVLTVQFGQVWLTRSGDPADVVLRAGQSFSTSSHDGKLVLQPLGADLARISITPR